MLMKMGIYYKSSPNQLKTDQPCFLKSFKEWEQQDLVQETFKALFESIEREQALRGTL
jgi:DNA-directed RNA polymerase specialized sigma24 family protein